MNIPPELRARLGDLEGEVTKLIDALKSLIVTGDARLRSARRWQWFWFLCWAISVIQRLWR